MDNYRKIKVTIILLVIILFSYGTQASSKEKEWLSRSCEDKNMILSDHLMLYLRTAINNCLATYYGKPKQSLTRIVYIDHHIPDDEIQIEAQTFTGPHNPPYGKDILTFLIAPDGNITLIDYQHTDIDTLEVES